MSQSLRLRAAWPEILEASWHDALGAALLAYLRPLRWFRGKSRPVRSARILEVVPLWSNGDPVAAFVMLEIAYETGAPEAYALPLAQRPDGSGAAGADIIAWLEGPGPERRTALIDGLVGGAPTALVQLVLDGATWSGERGHLIGTLSSSSDGEALRQAGSARASVSAAEQTNTTVKLGDRALLKIYRQVIAGPNPELEMGRFLSNHPRQPPVPRVLGSIIHRDDVGVERSVAIFHALIPNDGDAWSLAKRELGAYFDGVGSSPPTDGAPTTGRFRELAGTLGRRTAELHLALAEVAATDAAFTPEPLTAADRAAATRGVELALEKTLTALEARQRELPARLRAFALRLLDPTSPERGTLAALLERVRETPIAAMKTRIHGDLHLGQVLVCRDDSMVVDFMIVDFEGEPSRPLAERRAKSSPVRDVVGMLRSFSYAPGAVLRERGGRRSDVERLTRWADLWNGEIAAAFQRAYLASSQGAPFIPDDPAHLKLLLELHTLERVVYEIGYELDNRPDWTEIPLRGLESLLSEQAGSP
ncbi:MAG: 1,4-alpha-glucan branching enzyme [Myxococcales bacterium]|nr:1,4-alpha-glucan branching enzyme [Myxococcales bacterium]